MADEEEPQQQEDEHDLEHPGGGRFNRRLLIGFAAVAVIASVVAAEGIRSTGITAQSAGAPPTVCRQNLLDKLAIDLREDLVHLR